MTDTEIFNSLEASSDDSAAMIKNLVDHFRQARKPMELFEAMKMQVRQRLGLPLIPAEDEQSRPEEVERQLEVGLLDACREAGVMLLEDGKVAEGWMYLRPTGETELAGKLLSGIEISDDNYDDMVQILLHEGVDVGRGYQAVIDHQGTCNSITLFEQAVGQRSKADRRAAAKCLLDHLYSELVELVRGDIIRREAPAGDHETLEQMIDSRPWILGEGGYHLDTTHLASTVRIASVLNDQESLRKAKELTQYGRRLHHQFQYPGDEPFVDFYPAYAAFYGVLLGENVDAGLKLFERKAKTVDTTTAGTGAIETYVDLLERSGRPAEAIEAAITLTPDSIPSQRLVPMLIGLASAAESTGNSGAFDRIKQYCRENNDILGYAAVANAASTA